MQGGNANFLLSISTFEDQTTTSSGNTGNQLPSDVTSYHRTRETWAIPPQEPKNWNRL